MDNLKDLELWSSAGKLFMAFVSGGLLTAYLQIFFKKKAKKEEEKSIVKYLALRLAFIFEGYAIDCADKAADHEVAYDSDQAAGCFIGKVPELTLIPLEEGYKLLDLSLLNDILDFPQRCDMANKNAMFWDDVVGDRDSCTNALAQNTIEMGARAMDIGKQLREKYDLSSRNLSYGEFDMAEFLQKELKKLKAFKGNI